MFERRPRAPPQPTAMAVKSLMRRMSGGKGRACVPGGRGTWHPRQWALAQPAREGKTGD
jgi:hypothetical protein